MDWQQYGIIYLTIATVLYILTLHAILGDKKKKHGADMHILAFVMCYLMIISVPHFIWWRMHRGGK